MIVPFLQGGLGNQLFQVASIYAHARRHRFEFAINPSLNSNNKYKYETSNILGSVLRNFPLTDYVPKVIIEEKSFSYKPLPATNHAMYHGYFQSSLFFDECKEDLKDLFTIEPSEICRGFVNSLEGTKIGIHVRLGDYLYPRHFRKIFYVCKKSYYLNAIHKIRDQADNNNFIICSNDMCLAKRFCSEIPLKTPPKMNQIDDMYLLSHCQKLVLSNSSFSWWSAFFGPKKEMIIYPDKWFAAKGPQDYYDIAEKDWIVMSTKATPSDLLFDFNQLSVIYLSKITRQLFPKI